MLILMVGMDEEKHVQISHKKLAFSATVHCLTGCGIGEVLGVIIGVALGLASWLSLTIGVILGFIFGFLLGIIPLLRVGKTIKEAFKIIFVAEFLSIVVMETAEVLIEVYTPGVMSAGLTKPIFWLGMLLALTGGFIAAYPVNYIMVKKGVRHQH